jgi:protoheme IX farnesyltransferase
VTTSTLAGARIPVVLELFELTKPRVLALVMVTMLCGALIAPGPREPWTLALALSGTALVVGSANALNMFLERETDALMTRTRTRPLPSGRMQPELALWFGLGLGLIGLVVLGLWVNLLSAALTLLALSSYVLVYTPLKRVTPFALHVGAVPGAIPPLIGWASVTGSIGLPGLVLFAILFVWQLPHFLAIAVFRQSEYERASLSVLPSVRGLAATKRSIVGYSFMLVSVSFDPVVSGMAGWVYGSIAAAAGLWFLVHALRGLGPNAREAWSRTLFLASMPYLVVVFGALVVSAS